MSESKKITSSEIIQANLFDNTTKSAKKLSDVLAELEIGFEDLIKIQKQVLSSTPLTTAENIRKVTLAIKENEKVTKAYNEVKKEQTKIQEQEIKVEKQSNSEKEKKVKLDADALARNQVAKKDFADLIKLKKAQLILEDETRGTLESLNAANTVLRISREKLIATDKNYNKELTRINKLIDINNAQIIKQSDQLKRAKLNVGNYSASIKDALGNTGLFNGTLGQISNSLKGVIANFKAAEGGAAKLSTTLKGIAAIGIVGIIAGLAAIMQSSQGIIDEFALGWARVKDELAGLFNIKTGFGAAEQATQDLRISIRKLNGELQELVLAAEDFKEISEDTTLSFQVREENLKKFQDARLKASEKALEIAKEEQDAAEKALIAGIAAGITNNTLANEYAAAKLKVKAAEDDVQDSVRISATENRKLTIDRITQEVELLRSKKKSSTASIEILKQQIADEKRQITQREADLLEFNQINKDTYEEQIKRIEEGTGVQIDQVDLLREKDNQAFAEKIKNLKLGVELTALVATVVKKAQDAELQGAEQLAKIEEDKVKRNIIILNIKRDIAKITREDDANDLELKKSENELAVENLKIAAEQDLFDRKKQDAFKEGLGNLEVDRANAQQKRLENLDAERIDSLLRADEEINDLDVRVEAKLKIEKQYEIGM